MHALALFLILACFASLGSSSPCSPRLYGTNRTVCVCTSSFCDEIDPVGTIPSGQAVLYQSTKSGLRMARSVLAATPVPNKISVSINTARVFQEVKGFGGAFTDSAGINILTLDAGLQQTMMRQYFSPDGLGYTIGRVPIASCDFSTHEYSYDDVPGDMALTNFNLTSEDFKYKLPYIKQALQYAGGSTKLKLFATPWSAPGWMKTNDDMKGGGLLDGAIDGPYYATWANYIVKFFEEYSKQGVTFWGLTAQNEPTTGYLKNYKWQTMFFNASMQRDFIKTLLGPTLKASPITKNLKLMIMDDQRFNLPHWPNVVLSDKEAAQYVSGIALHWYEDAETPSAAVLETHNKWPNYFMLGTEACTAYEPGEGKPILGDWFRAEVYAHSIITDMNNWVTGWTDWNLCLDLKGGPNWVGNTVDAAIIVNSTANEYYKQPMFYALAHFSHFMPPGSLRVGSELFGLPEEVQQLPFQDPTGKKGVVLVNLSEEDHYISVNYLSSPKKWYSWKMEAKSINTLIFED